MEVRSSVQEEIIIETIQNSNHQPQARRYRKGRLLGRGGFANCYQGTNMENNNQVAIKVIEKKNLLRNRSKQKLLSEIKIHKMLKHPHIVNFLTVFEDIKRVFIIVELCQNNALSDFVRRRKRLSSIEVKRFMLQLLQAIEYLHSLKIIHRDLKMANIFLDSQMNIKVGDLGLATKLQFQDERKRTMCGTPNYIAPEIISGGVGHSYEVDIWSSGVICYAMMYGRPPFQASETTKTYERIRHGLFDFPAIQGITDEFKDFVSKILIVDPKRRMTVQQMKKHPFLNVKLPPITYNKITLTPIYDNILLTCKSVLPDEENVFSSSKDRNAKEKNSTDLTLKSQGKKQDIDRNGIQNKWDSQSVLCYVDYSTKYGLGYILSNGIYGVYFNDSSLLYTSRKDNLYFYTQNPSLTDQKFTKFTKQQIEKVATLQKKYTLMKKFIIYLDDQLSRNGCGPIKQGTDSQSIYIKQWLKTKHAIMFRLNNKVFQVDFFDGSRVSLQTDSKKLMIKSKKGQIKYTCLQDALEEKDGQLSRRIKYIRQILNRIKQK